MIAGVGVCAGRSNINLSAWISILLRSSFSLLLRVHASALVSSADKITLSCNSSNTDVSMPRKTSLAAIVLTETIEAVTLLFLASIFFSFFPSVVIMSPRYL